MSNTQNRKEELKPVVYHQYINAMLFTDESKDRVFQWIASLPRATKDTMGNPTLTFRTQGKDAVAVVGDWIVRDAAGKFHVCKPEVFSKTYEALTPLTKMPVALAAR